MNGVEGPSDLAARLMGRKQGPGASGPGQVEKERSGLKKAAQEFEALFLNQMLKTMRETVEESELFHGGSGEKIYTSLMDMELSREMASSGGMGLSEVLIDYFSGAGLPAARPPEGAATGDEGVPEKDGGDKAR